MYDRKGMNGMNKARKKKGNPKANRVMDITSVMVNIARVIVRRLVMLPP